jgi:hypothetical protein
MTQIIKQRIVIVLKILTVISFLCIVIDSGKFELPMIWLIVAPFFVSTGYLQDADTVLYGLQGLLYYGMLFSAALLYLFITAVSPTFSKKATIISFASILVLWLRVALTVPTSFPHPSFMIALTHGIFAFLSLTTMIFIGLAAKKGKAKAEHT